MGMLDLEDIYSDPTERRLDGLYGGDTSDIPREDRDALCGYARNEQKRILIIGEKTEFIVERCITDLTSRGFMVDVCLPEVSEVAKMGEDIHLCLLMVEYASAISTLLIYLRDLSYDKHLRVCMICNKNDEPEIAKTFPAMDITRIFNRPVNIKELGAELDDIYKRTKGEARKKNILMIDDDASYLRMLQMSLKENYRVYMVTSGAAAIRVMAQHPIDLILLDYSMPIADGACVFQMLKAEPELNGTPIFFLTGKNDVESIKTLAFLRPEKIISKSTKVPELLAIINEFFAYKQS